MAQQRGFKQGVGSSDIKNTEREPIVPGQRNGLSQHPRVGSELAECVGSASRASVVGFVGFGVVGGCLVDAGLGQALPTQGPSAE